MVDELILKKQVTSYFLEKNIAAIIKVITDVCMKKRVSKEYRNFGPWTRRSTGEPCCSEARRNIWPLPRRNR